MTRADQLWRKALLFADATISEALRSLDDSALRIILVIDRNEVLIGTVSDGDIRRGLLNGLDLNSSIAGVICRNALVVPSEVRRSTIVQMMTANRVLQIPVVDSKRRVIGLHLWNEIALPLGRSNIMVLMAGGRGVRLRPYTDSCPKPLLKIEGKPLLEHIIGRAKLSGIRHFVIAVNYLGDMIENYFGDGSSLEVQIEYLREEMPLGTAGALSLLNPSPRMPILVTNGDVITDISYGELLDFHDKHMAAATMAVRLYERPHHFGVIQLNGIDVVGFEEKPLIRDQINAGVYVLEPDALNLLEANEHCDMPTLLKKLRDRNDRVIAYPVHEAWTDVGRPSDFAALQKNKN